MGSLVLFISCDRLVTFPRFTQHRDRSQPRSDPRSRWIKALRNGWMAESASNGKPLAVVSEENSIRVSSLYVQDLISNIQQWFNVSIPSVNDWKSNTSAFCSGQLIQWTLPHDSLRLDGFIWAAWAHLTFCEATHNISPHLTPYYYDWRAHPSCCPAIEHFSIRLIRMSMLLHNIFLLHLSSAVCLKWWLNTKQIIIRSLFNYNRRPEEQRNHFYKSSSQGLHIITYAYSLRLIGWTRKKLYQSTRS